ncbi:MAG TPA: POTRA domain-containing protein, partial [Candidatus Sulfotelmatobacter sp.]|nr:POTRA domain-containing protein [Candidatus Sulfotelmatobacter sp.]
MKMIKKIVLLLLCLCCLTAAAARAATPEVEVAPLITALDIQGNKLVNEKEISNVIFTRVGEAVSEEKIKSDLKAIYALGYFSDVTSSFESAAGGTRVIFKVVENPRIQNISFSGNTVYASAELAALVDTKVGAVLNFKTMQDDIEKVNARYKKDGYMLARVIDVETDKAAGTLRFLIIEGVVESITLDGNEN